MSGIYFNGYTVNDIQEYFDSVPIGDSEYRLKHKDYNETIYRNMPFNKTGFIELYRVSCESNVASVAISVHPYSRRQGVATKLIEGAKMSMKDLGLIRLEYYVDKANTASIKLAQKAGFKIDDNLSSHGMYTMTYDNTGE